MTDEPLRGRLLVAAPTLGDPNFSHTVVLLLEHTDEGALGLVLNRPSDVTVELALPDWHAAAAEPPVVFVGGPVQPNAVIAIGCGTDGTDEIIPGLTVVDLAGAPAPPGARVRVFAGYAGWGAGQLEDEIAAGGWYLVDGTAADTLTAAPDDLWAVVLRRQGGLFTTIPENPSQN
jgi:putative transcriptional regulator